MSSHWWMTLIKVILCGRVFSTLPVSIPYDTRGHDGSQSLYLGLSHLATRLLVSGLSHISQKRDLPLYIFQVFRFLPHTTISLDLPFEDPLVERCCFDKRQQLARRSLYISYVPRGRPLTTSLLLWHSSLLSRELIPFLEVFLPSSSLRELIPFLEVLTHSSLSGVWFLSSKKLIPSLPFEELILSSRH